MMSKTKIKYKNYYIRRLNKYKILKDYKEMNLKKYKIKEPNKH